VKKDLKSANAKAWAKLKKLEALAERGIDGERLVAQRMLKKLKARLDFSGPAPAETPDLFRGKFKGASQARHVYSFNQGELDVANSVKWAIEAATGIRCVYRGCDLLAEAAPGSAKQLTGIAGQIAVSFRTLISQFSAVAGVTPTDRRTFIMGLYDGMMNDPRDTGQPLPSRPRSKAKSRAKTPAASPAGNLHVHPYTIACGLGKQIRFSVPLSEIVAELQAVTLKRLN
jgi:hypothetical protein